jgi:hypothetical protein
MEMEKDAVAVARPNSLVSKEFYLLEELQWHYRRAMNNVIWILDACKKGEAPEKDGLTFCKNYFRNYYREMTDDFFVPPDPVDYPQVDLNRSNLIFDDLRALIRELRDFLDLAGDFEKNKDAIKENIDREIQVLVKIFNWNRG